jgi:hypothetical protein
VNFHFGRNVYGQFSPLLGGKPFWSFDVPLFSHHSTADPQRLALILILCRIIGNSSHSVTHCKYNFTSFKLRSTTGHTLNLLIPNFHFRPWITAVTDSSNRFQRERDHRLERVDGDAAKERPQETVGSIGSAGRQECRGGAAAETRLQGSILWNSVSA